MEEAITKFQEAVVSFDRAVSQTFYSAMGCDTDPDLNAFKKQLVELFREVPEEAKVEMRNFLLQTMFMPVNDERLANWRMELGKELGRELEKELAKI
jgi:hypothetical protein